jgi:LysM repeat protein
MVYETKIDEIRRFNNLAGKTIYTGQKLLIQKGATQQPYSQAGTLEKTPTAPPKTLTATPTRIATDIPKPATNSTVSENVNSAYWLKLVGKIILLAFFLHGVVVLLSRRTKKD